MRRVAQILALTLSLGMLGVAVHLSQRSSPAAAPDHPRVPTHPAVGNRRNPEVQAGLNEIDSLRKMRSQRQIPMGGVGDVEYEDALVRLRRAAPGILYYLEETALNRSEHSFLRVDLINLVAQHPGEETRKFLSMFVVDGIDDEDVRIAALEPFMKYRDPATFEALRAAWRNPAPFEGRYHLCRAFGENGQPSAVPILREALAGDRPMSVRCHAATALGAFVADESVRLELTRLSQEDPMPAVRQNALQALKRGRTP